MNIFRNPSEQEVKLVGETFLLKKKTVSLLLLWPFNAETLVQPVQEKTIAVVETIRLFEKGLSSFEGGDRSALAKHLVKTLCTEIMTELLRFVCQENQVDVDTSKELNVDQVNVRSWLC